MFEKDRSSTDASLTAVREYIKSFGSEEWLERVNAHRDLKILLDKGGDAGTTALLEITKAMCDPGKDLESRRRLTSLLNHVAGTGALGEHLRLGKLIEAVEASAKQNDAAGRAARSYLVAANKTPAAVPKEQRDRLERTMETIERAIRELGPLSAEQRVRAAKVFQAVGSIKEALGAEDVSKRMSDQRIQYAYENYLEKPQDSLKQLDQVLRDNPRHADENPDFESAAWRSLKLVTDKEREDWLGRAKEAGLDVSLLKKALDSLRKDATGRLRS